MLTLSQDVDEFVSSSDLEKCSIASLPHHWILCSEWVPSEWESDKNITIIHKRLNAGFVSTFVFSREVWIIVMFLSDSHSDGTHSLQSIHCWDTDAETHFSKSDEEKLIYIVNVFLLNYFFNILCSVKDEVLNEIVGMLVAYRVLVKCNASGWVNMSGFEFRFIHMLTKLICGCKGRC